jgi:hypothetical protein
MARANKTYGFTIAVKELKETVPNIFRYASAYKRKHNLKSQGLWEMFVEPEPEKPTTPGDKRTKTLPNEILQTEPGHQNIEDIDPEAMEGEKYNMCHFWSNFEIARLDWFRSKEYNDFFEMMDHSGGFWMERVSKRSAALFELILTHCSGEMLPSTRLRQVPFWRPAIYITSATLATAIPRFNTVQPTPLLDNFLEFPGLRRRRKMRKRGKRKMITGQRQTRPKKTELGVGVDVTPTFDT